jgi:hypothetical protein
MADDDFFLARLDTMIGLPCLQCALLASATLVIPRRRLNSLTCAWRI